MILQELASADGACPNRPETGHVTSHPEVITDVDGTLMPFGTNTKISETNQLALKKAFDEGLAVCVATGRIPGPWYDELCAQVPLGPGVFANGALVLEPSPGPSSPRILAASSLPASAMQTVLEETSGGRFGGLRILVLAATMWEGSLRYVEPFGLPYRVCQTVL